MRHDVRASLRSEVERGARRHAIESGQPVIPNRLNLKTDLSVFKLNNTHLKREKNPPSGCGRDRKIAQTADRRPSNGAFI